MHKKALYLSSMLQNVQKLSFMMQNNFFFVPRTKLRQWPIWCGTMRLSAICHFYGDCNYTKHKQNVQYISNIFLDKFHHAPWCERLETVKKLKWKVQNHNSKCKTVEALRAALYL